MNEQIKKLRELTGAGVIDCKKAIEEAGGDLDRAQIVIKEKGLLRAEKKSGRETGAGLLESYIHNNRIGVLLMVRCETDFAARSEQFKTLVKELAMQISAMDPATVDDLLKQPYVRDESMTVEQLIKNAIAQIGENIKVERFCRYEL